MAVNMEIIIGTYEEFLLGYKVEIKNEKPVLVQSFADKSHSGSIRCVAVQERWIATGATDDRIFIYDMSTRKQSQILLSHEGTINSLSFTPDGTHLLSAADDGRLICTRLKTWFTEATWRKAHSGSAVTHVSCHPSGKLALSLGSDLVLRTWNLVKGRVAYKTNLKSRNTLGLMPDCLSWSPTGDYFTLSGQRIVEFWSIKTADVVRTQKTKSKPICLLWIADTVCLVGLEDGKILWLTVDGDEEDKELETAAHNSRVKAMYSFKQNLVTASSSGEIKLWQIVENKRKLKEIATTSIGCRPTCISILDLEQFGENYVISSTIGAAVKDVKPTTSKVKSAPRGVVTIEYDNDGDNKTSAIKKTNKKDDDDDEEEEDEEDKDESEDDEDDDDDDSENEADSVAEEDNDGIVNSDDAEDNDIEDDDDEEEVDDDELAAGIEEESSDESEEEHNTKPVVRKSNLGKHKLQTLQNKNTEKNKKTKLDNITKQPKQQQKRNKQKNKK